jgi:hypothetical protein
MTSHRPSITFGRQRHIGMAVAFVLASVGSTPAEAVTDTTLKATYTISIAGLTVGRADVESRFSGNGYAAAIRGSTSGPSRLVSDATALLAGSGRIFGTRVLPATYDLETTENGFATHVKMAMRGGTVTDLVAEPQLIQAADRVPITNRHKTDVVDPLSAFLVPVDRPGIPSGHRACARTVKIFDGWTRYDIELYYKETKAVDGGSDAYSGRIIVCGARYVPVAGHRSSRKAVQTMADNKRLEVWLAPVKDTQLLVPYRMMIGTELGDLVIVATRFSASQAERRAEAN